MDALRRPAAHPQISIQQSIYRKACQRCQERETMRQPVREPRASCQPRWPVEWRVRHHEQSVLSSKRPPNTIGRQGMSPADHARSQLLALLAASFLLHPPSPYKLLSFHEQLYTSLSQVSVGLTGKLSRSRSVASMTAFSKHGVASALKKK